MTILNALEGKPLPVHGNGSNVRDWLYVEDHAQTGDEVRVVADYFGCRSVSTC